MRTEISRPCSSLTGTPTAASWTSPGNPRHELTTPVVRRRKQEQVPSASAIDGRAIGPVHRLDHMNTYRSKATDRDPGSTPRENGLAPTPHRRSTHRSGVSHAVGPPLPGRRFSRRSFFSP
ncbi:hypothetical protein NL676_001158 [Syzygium grande]|nr:hypothetical protein NL676_001158 [Syzygium grande]